MDFTQIGVTEFSIGATAGIGGIALGLQKLVKIWSGTKTDLQSDEARSDLMQTLRDENKALRESDRVSRAELNTAMRELGRLEMMEARVSELKQEIEKLEERYLKQELIMIEISKQNAILVQQIDKLSASTKNQG
jgi:anti-sigma28 factor (negative regulator of flagellin synthesis)